MKRAPALLLLIVTLALRAAEEVPPPVVPVNPPPAETPVKAAKSKSESFAPHDVEVRLKDGSALRGELKNTEPIVLKTSFGELKFPLDDIFQITHASPSAAADGERVAAALKDFKADNAEKQRAAEATLEDAGGASVDPLFELRGSAGPELKARIDTLLKKVIGKTAAPAPAAQDSVRSAKFEARGVLRLDAVKLSGRLGELTIKLADIDGIRWLSHGATKTLELDAESGVHDWLDTGIDANQGESITAHATGHATLFGSIHCGPSGVNGDAQPFPVGALVGRIGADGEPFQIGDSKTWKPDATGRLQLKIFVADDFLQNNQGHSTGRYSIRIATGPWSEESGAAPAAPTDGE